MKGAIKAMSRKEFLPVTREEMHELGWDRPDFVYVSGDAYVDHPSFGAAIITRVLESRGYRVAMLAQPNYRSKEDFMRFGRPRLAFLVSAGNIDSMVAHYTAAKKSVPMITIPLEAESVFDLIGQPLYTATE